MEVETCTGLAKDAVADWEDTDFLFAFADQMAGRNNLQKRRQYPNRYCRLFIYAYLLRLRNSQTS